METQSAFLSALQNTNQQLAQNTVMKAKDIADDERQRYITRMIVFGVVLSIIAFFAARIYTMRFRYPHMFRWYDRMRKEKVQGKGMHNFSMSQVATTATYTPVADMMSLLMAWDSINYASANFLMMCIEHFSILQKTEPKAVLTSLHWCGTGNQTLYDKLMGENGWASPGCTATDDAKTKKANLVKNWNASKDENIWYYLLPQPVGDDVDKFLNIPMIQELWSNSSDTGGTADPCDSSSFFDSSIAILFDGGLCNVAMKHSESNRSASDLFRIYFASDVAVKQSCEGSAKAGAVEGGIGAAMNGLFAGTGMGGGTVGIASAGLMAIIGGIAGYQTGGDAAKEKCQMLADKIKDLED